jgi:hypothetical protein
MSFVYFILDEKSDAIKIGKSDNVSERLSTLQTGNPNPLKIVKIIECKTAKQAHTKEKKLHNKFKKIHLNGEWFKYDKELFDIVLNEIVTDKKNDKNLITVNTLFGEENFPIFESIPNCYFYGELTAQIKDNYESASLLKVPFRTMEWPTNGQSLLLPYSNKKNRVFISTKKHQENLKENQHLKSKEKLIESQNIEKIINA